MKRFLTMVFGMALVFACCITPSFATSSTPVYPSGTAYQYISSSAPASSPSRLTSNWFTAVVNNLYYGFVTMSKGLNTLQTNTNTANTKLTSIDSSLTALKSHLYGPDNTSNYNYLNIDGEVKTTSSILSALNQSTYNGFRLVLNRFGTVNTNLTTIDGHITTMDGHITNLNTDLSSNISTLDNHVVTMDGHVTKMTSDMNTGFSALSGAATTLNTNLNTMDEHLVSGFSLSNETFRDLYFEMVGDYYTGHNYSVHQFDFNTGEKKKMTQSWGWFSSVSQKQNIASNLLAGILRQLYDPENEKLKDNSSDQKDELNDKFFGDGGNGVQTGQIGSLGDISSSAGDLLDTGGSVGNVFTTIGDSSSTVWDWFSSENSDAINGSGGVSLLADEDDALPTPTLEIVDFYGAQRDEFLSILGGGK